MINKKLNTSYDYQREYPLNTTIPTKTRIRIRIIYCLTVIIFITLINSGPQAFSFEKSTQFFVETLVGMRNVGIR